MFIIIYIYVFVCKNFLFLFLNYNSTNATVQIDYGYLNREGGFEEKDTFYTRIVFYQVLLTVHQNLEPISMDILNFKPLSIDHDDNKGDGDDHHHHNAMNNKNVNGTITTNGITTDDEVDVISNSSSSNRDKYVTFSSLQIGQVEELIKMIRWRDYNNGNEEECMNRMKNDYCLLTFDIRNAWHIAFDVTVECEEG